MYRNSELNHFLIHSENIDTKPNIDKGSCIIRQLKKSIENIPKAIDDTYQTIIYYTANQKHLNDLQKELEKHKKAVQDETYKELYSDDDNFENSILKNLPLEQSSSNSVDSNILKDLCNVNIENKLEYSDIYYPIMNSYPFSSLKFDVLEQGYSEKYDTENYIMRPKSRHYKTELCKRYLSSPSGDCSYGNKCQFAHGINELRFAPRHPRYKTEICYSFHIFGTCNYGRRCDFIHDEPLEKLILIRLQNQLFQAYRKSHPQVQEVRLIELLGLQEDNRESLQALSSALYDEKKFNNNDCSPVITNTEL